MNSEIASAAAWTPEDRRFMVTNAALNKLAAELAAARRAHPVLAVLVDGEISSVAAVQARSRIRLREMDKAILRAVTALHAGQVFV
jgi:hypothetical protein